MKNFTSYIFLKLTLVLITLGISAELTLAQHADSYSYKPTSTPESGWNISLMGGANVFWGDIRNEDFLPLNENMSEWGYAYSAILGRKLSNTISFRMQVLNGTLSGTNRPLDRYFKSNVTDFSGQFTINFANMFSSSKGYKAFEPYGVVGIGMTYWATDLHQLSTQAVVDQNGTMNNFLKSRTREVFAPVGFGFDINLSPEVTFKLENTWRIVDSDLLDATPGNYERDMYTFTSMGLRFNFPRKRNFKKSEKKVDDSYKDVKKITYTDEKTYEDLSKNQDKQSTSRTNVQHPVNTDNVQVQDSPNKYDLITKSLKTSISATMPKVIGKGEELLVTIIINKPNIFGAGTIRQDLPKGVKIVDYDVKGAKITLSNQIVSIFWYELPTVSEVKITYLLNTSEVELGTYNINGIFTFYKNHRAELLSFKNQLIVEESDPLIHRQNSERNNYNSSQDDRVKQIIYDRQNNQDQYNKKAVERNYSNNNNSYSDQNRNRSTISGSYDNVEFRVQIRAKYGSRLSITALKSRYAIDEEIYEDNYKGYYIYTVGSFRNYEDADAMKNSIRRSSIPDAFVVAFRNGKRLTSLSEL
jgi:hypothetical protein